MYPHPAIHLQIPEDVPPAGCRVVVRFGDTMEPHAAPGHDDGEVAAGASGTAGDLAELVERIHAGDRAAEAALVTRFSRGLMLMLRHLAADAALAEDLHQDTLSLVIEKIRRGEVREPERIAGFIRSTARNLFIANRRKAARYTTLEAGGDDEGARPALDLVAAGPAGLDQVLADDEARLVRRLLGELRFDRDRQVLIRFYLAEDGRDEICAALGIDPQRFNQVLHRARERLRELWDKAEKRRRFFSRVRGFAGRG